MYISFLQELLEQLHQQQRMAHQQEAMRNMAKDLINQAYLDDEATSRRHMNKDRAHAAKLLDDAFPLANTSGTHRSAPTSPPSSSSSTHGNSVRTEPSRGQRTSLEKLLSGTSLSQVETPIGGAQRQSPTRAWDQANALSSGDSSMGSTQRRALLRAIREELKNLKPNS